MSQMKPIGSVLITLLALLGVWELVARVSGLPNFILPPPTDVWASGVRNAAVLAGHAIVTLAESVSGLAIGVGFGIITAVALYASATLRSSVMPFLVMFGSFPKIAIAPLLIVWLGLGFESKVALSALVSFFPVAVNVLSGLLQVEAELIEVMRSMSASRWMIFKTVRVPHSVPYLLDGVKIAIPMAIIGALVGEFIGGAQGLGYLLLVAGTALDGPLQFAALILMGVLSLAPFYLVSALQRTMIVRWKDPENQGAP